MDRLRQQLSLLQKELAAAKSKAATDISRAQVRDRLNRPLIEYRWGIAAATLYWCVLCLHEVQLGLAVLLKIILLLPPLLRV